MRVLHLISQHPEQTGSGFYVQNMIQQCQLKGHKVHLLAGVSGRKLPALPMIKKRNCSFISFEQNDLNFTIPGMSDVMPYPSSRFSALTEPQLLNYTNAFKEAILRVTEDFMPDVIHSHHLWLASAIVQSNCPEIPLVTSCHSTDIRQFLQNEHLRKRLSNIDQIDRILALSKNQQENISQVHGIEEGKIDIVGGGYDTKRFTMGVKETSPPVQFVYAGKLSSAKGVPYLLKAIAKMQKIGIHLHLVGSGSGPESDQCLQLASQVSDKVTVHGAMDQKDLARLMGKSHVFVLPSFFEGLPLVLLEALSSGCRILCSDLPGCRELLESAEPDMVKLIKLPPMRDVDKPDPDQLEPFVLRITEGLAEMRDIVTNNPPLQEKRIKELTKSFSWEAVFERVEKAYINAVAMK